MSRSKDHLLVEPVVVTEFWVNRRGHSLQIKFIALDGGAFVEIRKRTMADGKLVPTQSVVCIDILKLPLLAAGLNKAHKKTETDEPLQKFLDTLHDSARLIAGLSVQS